MNERIKLIREQFELTQEEFGKRIGSARNTIANYENGNRNPSNSVLKSICREFEVDEEWLRNGTGEMFKKLTDQEELMKYTALLLKGKDSVVVSAIQALIVTYEQLNDANKSALEEIATKYIENLKKSQ